MYEEAIRLYSRSLICPVSGSEALDKKWQSEEGKRKNSIGRVEKDFFFILLRPFFPSALQFRRTKNSY